MAVDYELEGKKALVTGGGQGVGRGIALMLAEAGATVLVNDFVASRAESVVAEIIAAGGKAQAAPFDVTNFELVHESFGGFGGVDILVVASGMNDVAPIVDMAPERFQKVMLANVDGAWLIARAVGRQMIAQGRGGKIVFTSSARGKLGHPAGYSAYCTSKSAVDGMTKALGCEWGKHGITVNAIAPTVFRSPLTEWMFADDEKAKVVRAGFLARVPIGRLGEPEDLAGPVLFLCSRASDFHTGHIIYADGGYTAG